MPVSLLGVSNRLFHKAEKPPCPIIAYILEIAKGKKKKTSKQIKLGYTIKVKVRCWERKKKKSSNLSAVCRGLESLRKLHRHW